MKLMRNLFNISIVTLFLFTFLSEAEAHRLNGIEQQVTDSIITTKITTKYTKNKYLNPLKISVSTQNGVVHISGNVKDKQAFVEALKLAIETKGVISIDTDDLEIKHVNTAFTDAYITAKIETAVLKAKVLDDESIPLVGINASTVNGVVTLTGTVKTTKAIDAILKRAHAVRGVKKIISNLRVLGARSL